MGWGSLGGCAHEFGEDVEGVDAGDFSGDGFVDELLHGGHAVGEAIANIC